MKIIFESVQPAKTSSRRRVAAGLFATAALLGILSGIGCGKSKPSAASPSPEEFAAKAAVTHEPVYTQKTVAVAPVVTPAGEPDMGELNRCLLRWVMGHRKKPDSFEEFAASANVVIPPAPAGKKYAIDKSMHIVLVKP